MKEKKTLQPATGKDIKTITGLEDSGVITAILGIGATPAEVLQAFEFLDNGYYQGGKATYGRDSNVLRICEILETQREMNELAERL